MIFLKAVAVIVAGLLTLFAVRRLMSELDAAKVRVRTQDPRQPRPATRLRQDPRTGVYYPEN
jgi:hypothetical protein